MSKEVIHGLILDNIREGRIPSDISEDNMSNLVDIISLSEKKFWENDLDIEEYGHSIGGVDMVMIDALREMYGVRTIDNPEPYDAYMYNVAVNTLWNSDYEYTDKAKSELYSRLRNDDELREYIDIQAREVHLSDMKDEGLIIPIVIDSK